VAFAYEPRINYMLQCMGCHTPDGSGEPGRVPSIKDTLAPFSLTPAGRRFLIQVPGASQSTLSDAELADLLNWMIQNLSVTRPAGFTPFTGAEVASYRRTPLVDVQATRQRLLQSTKAPASH
jgi:mono/diheme cytochrome c family protein